MGRRLSSTTLLAAAPVWLAGSGEAVAAAWTLPAGDGQAIVGGAFLKGDRYFDARGKLIPEAAYRKFELPILLEYGLTDRVTLIAAPSALNVSVATEPASRYSGAGYTDLGARVRLWSSDTDVISLQATTRLPGARDAANPAAVGWTDPEHDLRVLWGRSFAVGPWPAFLDGQLAYRLRAGGPADEIRVDVTLGARPAPQWLLLVQSFNTASVGAPSGIFAPLRSHKLSVSAAYTIGRWTLQLGAVASVAGRNMLRERGLLAALWVRF